MGEVGGGGGGGGSEVEQRGRRNNAHILDDPHQAMQMSRQSTLPWFSCRRRTHGSRSHSCLCEDTGRRVRELGSPAGLSSSCLSPPPLHTHTFRLHDGSV